MPFVNVQSFSENEGYYVTTQKEVYAAGETITVIGHVGVTDG